MAKHQNQWRAASNIGNAHGMAYHRHQARNIGSAWRGISINNGVAKWHRRYRHIGNNVMAYRALKCGGIAAWRNQLIAAAIMLE
jgi:hypothetical protein